MAHSAMCLIHDELVTHTRQTRRPETIYHLRLFVPTAPNGRLPVAVATEVFSNPGLSITNCCEELATGVMAYLWAKGYHFESLHWLEHYDDAISYVSHGRSQQKDTVSSISSTPPKLPERFALVEFEPGDEQRDGKFALRNPHWRHCTVHEVEALIDMSWTPIHVADSPE